MCRASEVGYCVTCQWTQGPDASGEDVDGPTNFDAQNTMYWSGLSSVMLSGKGAVGSLFSGSQIASGAHTMPAVASSTMTRRSFTQLTRSELSQTKIPLEPVRTAAFQLVCSHVSFDTTARESLRHTFPISKSVPTMYHFFPASGPPPATRAGSRTPLVPFVGFITGAPLLRALNDKPLLPLLR